MPVNEISVCDADGKEVALWQADDLRLRQAAQDLLDTLQLALEALNTVPRFAVRGRDLDSYEVAKQCDRAIRTATEGGAA
jgi:hypothetical protein